MSTQRQSMHSIHNKKFWTEFFYLYESLPALWDMNNPLYKNRQVKCDAYDIMVDKLREIEPNSDREDVLRKINIFRTNFRRECSRINMSLQEGRHYQSTLWYFDLLCFLQTADTRRERKRKLLDDDGEKSIMRKRRVNNLMNKSSDQYIIAPKKELIEYPTHSSHNEFEYELEEEPDFDYVPDELAHALVDVKSDTTTSEIPLNTLNNPNHRYHQADVEEHDEEDNQSQQDYSQQVDEYENYSLQRNIQKTELTADNVAHMDEEAAIEDNDDSQEQQDFRKYANENVNSVQNSQWCIKAENVQNISTIQLKKPGIGYGAITNATLKFKETPHTSTKFVRDVKTMTSSNPQSCCGKISESSEIVAKSWAVQYDELTQQQKLLARKAINDILFEACMGHLSIGSNGRVIIENTDYTNLKTKTLSLNEDVESGEIYEQSVGIASSSSSASGLETGAGTVVAVATASVASTPKANDEWLKL